MNIIPITMVKNEERFIAAVLQPLVDVFGAAVLGDTGSTDNTVKIAEGIKGVDILQLGPQTPEKLGLVRKTLSDWAALLGAEWIMVVDGDELYSREALLSIKNAEMPTGAELGFTLMLSIDEDEQGNFWELADLFSRACINRADVGWKGVYPFEAPEVWLSGKNRYHYFEVPAGLPYHGVHLHRLRRSGSDSEVYIRQQKQKQFCMRDIQVARRGHFDMTKWQES